MEPQDLSEGLIEQCMDELEYLPCHYTHHFADALRVVSLFYRTSYDAAFTISDQTHDIRKFAWQVHEQVAVEIFHFKPETDTEFVNRHCDKV